jgi:hypothetical protein
MIRTTASGAGWQGVARSAPSRPTSPPRDAGGRQVKVNGAPCGRVSGGEHTAKRMNAAAVSGGGNRGRAATL